MHVVIHRLNTKWIKLHYTTTKLIKRKNYFKKYTQSIWKKKKKQARREKNIEQVCQIENNT